MSYGRWESAAKRVTGQNFVFEGWLEANYPWTKANNAESARKKGHVGTNGLDIFQEILKLREDSVVYFPCRQGATDGNFRGTWRRSGTFNWTVGGPSGWPG